jgi:hypothetical protein
VTAARDFSYGDLPAKWLGATDKFGNITIQRGLTGRVFEETLRHETVHSVISRALGSLSGARMWLYGKSALYRYGEEALAEGYAVRSIRQGLAFAKGYVTPMRLGLELGGLGVFTGGAAYGIYEGSQ